MKKYLLGILVRWFLPDRLIPETTARKRFNIFHRIKSDGEILDLLRSEYTREYKIVITSWLKDTGHSKDFIQGFYTGRLFKLSELIRDSEDSELKLQTLEHQEIKNKEFGINTDGRIKSNLISDPY